MHLSAPVFVLKSHAKELKKRKNIPLSQALNEVAQGEGYASWSLLISGTAELYPRKFSEMLDFLNAGDLVLLAARPGMGKTTFAFGLVAQAIKCTRPKSHLFTLVERALEARQRLSAYSDFFDQGEAHCFIDSSDDICADYIISTTGDRITRDSLIVVDYLQLLDEKRINPPLERQIETLKNFAATSGCIIVFLCQLDRQIGERSDQRPTIDDIRLPNPLDLKLFNKIVFLYREDFAANEAEVSFANPADHRFKIALDRESVRFSDVRE